MPLLSIFTPTFNRAYRIKALYNSLLKQTCKNFEWVIVDDGSTDNTKDLVDEWINNEEFKIHYIKQNNGGKHRAINRGLEIAKGELFFIVDSDDWLSDNAIERINYHYSSIKDLNYFCGICGLKIYEDGKDVGNNKDFGVLDCNAIDFRYKYNIKGDMSEVFFTNILREYKFPDIEGEKFCPEALVYNRIAKDYKMRYFYEKIYYCEYLPDGLSANITKMRVENPIATCTYYAELSINNIPFYQKIKAIVNYWRFSFWINSKWSKKQIIGKVGFLELLLYPIGYIFFKNDRKVLQ
ncbi:MAG: glycosyltransferase family A protein [Bacteroidales bacterium]|nr:glycosyltransferase family A protein [Bacteroidales bacterium]